MGKKESLGGISETSTFVQMLPNVEVYCFVMFDYKFIIHYMYQNEV
jgi:hypothetical protein